MPGGDRTGPLGDGTMEADLRFFNSKIDSSAGKFHPFLNFIH